METQSNAVQPVFNAAGLLTLSTDVAKSEGKKRVKIGELAYYTPLLAAFGLDVAPSSYDAEGLPVYATDEQNWLFNAVHAAVKAAARNKLESGTASLKAGAKVAETLAELMEEGERGGNAEYLKAVTELKAKFGVWVGTLGKSKPTQDLLRGLFASPKNIALQEPANRPKFASYVSDFAETLAAEDLEKGQKYLQSLLDACTSESGGADDF